MGRSGIGVAGRRRSGVRRARRHVAAPTAHRREDVRPDRRRAPAVGMVAGRAGRPRADCRSCTRSACCWPIATTNRSTRSGSTCTATASDSVAWHGDRHRHLATNPVIAIVSVGAPRPFKLRPRGGGSSVGWQLGNGDLFVMGGACQHEWEHTVPKVRVTSRPASQHHVPLGLNGHRFDADQRRKTWASSANALNSRALPAGSSTNIVDCSPG